MIPAQDFHQLVLQVVDVLELVDHDVLEALLPLEPDRLVLPEDVQGELDQVVVIEPEAFLFLIEIAVENDVLGALGLFILPAERFQGHIDHIVVILRPLLELDDLDHVPRVRERHVPQREPPLLVDRLEHRVDVGVIQHEEGLRVLDDVAVLLQDRHAEPVERVDIPGVVVPGEVVDALAHLVGRLVRKRHAKNVAGKDPRLIHKIGESACQRTRLAGARARDNTDHALRRGHSFFLRFIHAVQHAAEILAHRPLLCVRTYVFLTISKSERLFKSYRMIMPPLTSTAVPVM